MRALRQTDFGDPTKVVQLVEAPDPSPQPDEVLIRVEAAAMHLADVKFIHGDPGFRFFGVPRWMGEEGVARVEALGPEVTVWQIGDRVFVPRGTGAFRDCGCVKAADLIAAPDGDADQLALAMINGLTAFLLLEDYARAQRGEWMIQNGANSSCGRFLIALARMKGVHTVSLVRRPELIDELQALGADVVLVDTGDPDDMQRQVAAATDDAAILAGIDCVAGPATRVIARCLAPAGRVINYGFMTGLDCHMAFQDMFLRKISLEGMNLKNDRSPDEMATVYERLAGLIGRGELRAKIAAAYTLEQAQEAIAHQQRTGIARQGKIIIRPNG
ncbi:MAG: zinc-dependent alcohol dehydrogenase family protein [Gammaproteobacteria bacterium]|nr:zinc-dependent alcohol dehydrogenase family protein [Gammaproteobacteria bacterium]